MSKKILKRLLDMFPYFLTRNPESNFVKSQSVTSQRFKDLYIALRDTYESFRLDKRCLIFKEQDCDYDYTMHFICNIPLLEYVAIYEDDVLIYESFFELCEDESYSYMIRENIINSSDIDEVISSNEYLIEDNITGIDYSYSSTSENIIPITSYRISVKTFDEYECEKGFPENDTIQNNIYDHDISLDELGALNNIPRKKYIPTTDFAKTEPPYNDRTTEDDYHYMQRMLMYNLLIHQEPLPVAEIFKLYGISSNLINRDRFIIRMFDIFKHEDGYYYDETADGDRLFVNDWIPEPWEHKDRLCETSIDLGEYFYVSANTLQPVRKQKVFFTFEFLNSLMEALTGDYTVDIYLDGELIIEAYKDKLYNVDLSLLSTTEDNVFYFEGKLGDWIIGTWTETIHIRGCNDADFYVNANGSDDNDGTRAHPFQTLERAVTAVNGIYDLIAVQGSISIDGAIAIPERCIIIGCGNAKINNNSSNVFFNIEQDQYLILQDLTLTTSKEPVFKGVIDNQMFTNDNYITENTDALTYSMDNGVLIEDLEADYFIKDIKFDTNTGLLSWTRYTPEEFQALKDLNGIIHDMELIPDDDVYYSKYTPVTTDEKLLNYPFVYFEDREELTTAIQNLTYDYKTGILELSLCGDEIVWQAKSHSI